MKHTADGVQPVSMFVGVAAGATHSPSPLAALWRSIGSSCLTRVNDSVETSMVSTHLIPLK